ncbi:unnamed protein product [Kluyveromyces dobzhanskii CBS 2104]|uniref:acid phosphatase n=1 Tax=Kluyveromyces dobzhanskii CBS 2104 TaxID=1427455 RepID=A0A0A8L849_9SACH|nr:unnamed protein product [Kluyveromyces dobzhanskii CBS 2104]
MKFSDFSLLGLGAIVLNSVGVNANTADTSLLRTYSTVSPSASAIEQAIASTVPAEETSSVEGAAFKNFYIIYLENTDYDKAAGDESLAWLATQGITLTNYWALTHPSEPNYLASVSGDYFALDDDRFIALPSNVSTIVDLLDTKGISWAEYQEHSPYAGFEGFNYSNQETFANDYVRKHNPLVLFDSVTNNETRLANIKNFEDFDADVANKKLPQYAFITPNMTNDGHDTTIKFAGKWAKDFLEPLLQNEYFMNDTLVLLTFDENETYSIKNKVFSVLLGGVIPDSLKGTTDDTFYDHYTQLSSVQANWDLPHLGRHDFDANVLQLVANATNITNLEVDTTYMVNNETYIGYLNDRNVPLPAPNVTAINRNGQPILDSVKETWEDEYNNQVSASYFTSTTTTVSADVTDAETIAVSTGTSAGHEASAAATTTASSNTTSSGVSSASAGAASLSTLSGNIFLGVLAALFL